MKFSKFTAHLLLLTLGLLSLSAISQAKYHAPKRHHAPPPKHKPAPAPSKLPPLPVHAPSPHPSHLPSPVPSAVPSASPSPTDPVAVALQNFAIQDQTLPPPTSPVLFIGSSTIQKWTTMSQDFPGLPALNRGISGTTFQEITPAIPQLVFKYAPSKIVIYSGDNDLALDTAGSRSQKVFADFQALIQVIQAKYPLTPIYVISIKPSPSRLAMLSDVRAANTLIAQYVSTMPTLHYIDVFTEMLDTAQQPRAELFVTDGLHLSEQGYSLWTSIIRPILEAK